MTRRLLMGNESKYGSGYKPNYINGKKVTAEYMNKKRMSNKNALKKRGASSGMSAEAKAMQDKQQGWLDKSGGIADKQSGVGSKMEERADRIGNRDIAAGEASSEVASAHDAAQGQQNRNLRRYGMDPNSGRFAHGQQVMANARAAADAGARTKARRNADRDSIAAYGQTQNAFSQAANTNFGVYDRYDKLTDEFSANQNYQEPTGSNFGGGSIGGGSSRSGKRVNHNALQNSRQHVTFNKQGIAQNQPQTGGFNLGPDNVFTPLKQDTPDFSGIGGAVDSATQRVYDNVGNANYGDMQGVSGSGVSAGNWSTTMPFDYVNYDDGIDWEMF